MILGMFLLMMIGWNVRAVFVGIFSKVAIPPLARVFSNFRFPTGDRYTSLDLEDLVAGTAELPASEKMNIPDLSYSFHWPAQDDVKFEFLFIIKFIMQSFAYASTTVYYPVVITFKVAFVLWYSDDFHVSLNYSK